MRRREFFGVAGTALAAGAALWAGFGVLAPHEPRPGVVDVAVANTIPGRMVGQNYKLGHLLRPDNQDATLAGATQLAPQRTQTVIVGGGMAGLSAAWALDRAGATDYVMLEMEREAGGTSAWHDYPESSAPWGAHYLPLPTAESHAVRALLADFGVLGADGTFDDLYLCQAPQERLYIDGIWQEGIYPHVGATAAELSELDRFHAEMEKWRRFKTDDGRPPFAIPLAYSSADLRVRALDAISMADFLDGHDFHSKRLRWFVEYGCRDDYGCNLNNTSAWMGVHYFASRPEQPQLPNSHADVDLLLTWPEGNGWLARRLRQRVGERLRPQTLAFRVSQSGGEVVVSYFDAARGQGGEIRARRAIVALPRFVAARVVDGYAARMGAALADFTYAPWVVSNIVVDQTPPEPDGGGQPLCWDNVFYNSPSLGYVVATHQSLRTVEGASVLTHYQPFVGDDDMAERRQLIDRQWEYWRGAVLADMARAHPGFERSVRRLDTMVWGHAMVRPRPHFMWSRSRQQAAAPLGRVYFAHTDLSGLAIFEEANYHGVAAAEAVLRAEGHSMPGLLGAGRGELPGQPKS